MSAATDPALLGLAAAARALRERALSATELVEACLARIGRWQPVTNAYIALESDEVLADAARLSAVPAAGPLGGVPLAHKDMFYRTGKVSNCGSAIRRGWVADSTSTAITRLQAAGALQLGTLHMVEFAHGPAGDNRHWGDCCNPWNPDYVTGGSSSGSGAAVAARLCFGALGSDTGGSVRAPAAICGVTGLKTSWGRVPRTGVMPLSHSLDTVGPLARSAEDCALMLSAIAGGDAGDPVAADRPVPDYAARLGAGIRGLRIGIASDWIARHAEPQVADAIAVAAGALQAQGAVLVEVPAPDVDRLSAHCMLVIQAESSAQHAQWMRERPQDYSAVVRSRLEAGFAVPATVYLESLRLRGPSLDHFRATTLAQADVFLLPAINIATPTREQVGPKGGPDMPRRLGELTRNFRWVNYLGLPAVVAPCGSDANGMPIGLQLVGRPFDEATLLAAAHAYQQASDWHARVPVLPAARG